MDWFNPVEWLAWVYGKLFQNHAFMGGAVVVALFAILGLVLWLRAVDKYKEEHSPKQQAVTTSNPSASNVPATISEAAEVDAKSEGSDSPANPLKKRTSRKPNLQMPDKPSVSSSGTGSPAIGGITQGSGSALSVNQQGGITAVTIIGTPPCPWNVLTQRDFIKIAILLSSPPAKIYVAIPQGNDDAARFAGYLQPALKTISHWNTDDFEVAIGAFWAKYPGITVIARDKNDFSDLTKPAAKLKNAIQSLGIAVHTEQVVTLKGDDDLGLWVGACE
jgi:hypothetical protein